jgi:hypothetical protein
MPERDGYPAGVPCWVNVALPDPAAFDLGDGDSYTIWRVPGYDPGDRGDVDAPDDVAFSVNQLTG